MKRVEIEPNITVQLPKIAIVGMDAAFGSCQGLDAFERSIYEGTQHFVSPPTQRWEGVNHQVQLLKDHGFENDQVPRGAYIENFEFNPLHFKVPHSTVDKLNSQQLLLLKVAEGALGDAGIQKGANVAVIVSAAETREYPSYIDNIIASRISALWNFMGPTFTLAAGDNFTFEALENAQMLLATGEVDAVLVAVVDLAGGVEDVLSRNQSAKINTGVATLGYDRNANGWMIGEGAGAVVLKHHKAAQKDSNPVYAVIEAISLIQPLEKRENYSELPSAKLIAQACQQAFKVAKVQPDDISYVEVYGSGIQQEDDAEIEGLTRGYQSSKAGLNCALGSVKANIGHTYTASGMASLIKTALCIYHRYIPAVPQWSGPKVHISQDSPFYIASESRPWCLETGSYIRLAAINSLGRDGTCAHLVMSEAPKLSESSIDRSLSRNSYLEQMPFHLFPVAAVDRLGLLEQVHQLQQVIEDCSSLSDAASQTFTAFQEHSQETYALVILGRRKDELSKECQRAFQGITRAFEQGDDWKTPLGSYFTANPLAKKGTVAYAYPGAFGSYVGLGRDIFRLFPKIWDDPVIKNTSDCIAKIDKLIYPRSLNKLSVRQLEKIEKELVDNILSMLEVEMGFATVITLVMKDYFQIQPQSAFGYSLGETSMLCAQGVWANFSERSDALNSSALFKTRLSGPKDAVREYWKLPQNHNRQENEEIWSTYVLMASASEIMNCLKHENRVYLTQINTPKEAVIAGDPEACQRVIKTLNCDAFRAPLNHAIHCEAMRSEYDELVKLNTLPIQNISKTTIYSAVDYQPIDLDAELVSHHVAKGLCQPLDFPRLVNRVYDDGSRIFIEAGAGSICSRWIDEILGQKEHITISLNRRGTDDFTSIVKALAQLLSHRVPVDLSPLYGVQQNPSERPSFVEKMTLGKCDQEALNALAGTKSLIREQLSESSNQIAKAHKAFLETRQESLEQMAEIIQLQVNLAQQMLNEMAHEKNS